MSRKYNYVVMGSEWDLYKQSYADLSTLSDALYITDKKIRDSKYMRLSLSARISKYIKLPIRESWNDVFFSHKFPEERPICFIFFTNWVRISERTGFIKNLKAKYPNSKFVWFLQDLYIRSHYSTSPFDLVISYDKGESKKYGFTYHPTVFSRIEELPESMKNERSDIYFIGKAKDRLSQIIKFYESLMDAGLSCDFYLTGVPSKHQQYSDKIHYLEKPISYKENLQHAQKSKCLLEIMQGNAVGYTFRLWETITLKKKLLSNNLSLVDSEFYSPHYISLIDKEISSENIEFVRASSNYDYPQRDKLSPIQLLNFIDSKL